MTASTTVARSPHPRLSVPPPAVPKARVVPSAPQLFPLGRLVRAAENVRRIQPDEDVQQLADDILEHGLLSSLIGYLGGPGADATVHIVGGGRRLNALDALNFDGHLTRDFPVPVLIRDKALAVELSLAENLQQRSMSPVDEFFAFRALVDTGHHSPADLAKRFGFSERVVKQRLRLAELEPEILDALAERRITLDSAMAYAGTQDRALQKSVFDAEAKRSRDAHAASNVRHALASKGMRTSHPLYRFVGAEAYERRGGRYEDDLFRDDAGGDTRVLGDPVLVQTIAAEHIDFQMQWRLVELRDRPDLSPTIEGFVVVPGLKLHSWGHSGPIAAPAGTVQVTREDHAPMWRTIRNNGIAAHILVGINDAGELIAWPQTVFVEKGQVRAIDRPPARSRDHATITPEQQAELERVRGELRHARQLALHALGGTPLFAGTPLAGRGWWADRSAYTAILDGMPGVRVCVDIFISDEEVAAHRKAGDARYRKEVAAREARAAEIRSRKADADRRLAELRAMTPPAIVAVDGVAWERLDDGSYRGTTGDSPDVADWSELLDCVGAAEIDATWPTREAWAEAQKGAAL
ncbi:ParB/RepB/Spo0J family partition protein [Sphingomonas sp. VNH70]|uniref:ParB/RepB/Spo0J family partition protein n=1 Tax=Sphingomonas silueang TaxID=3156617 RepID=UPI0032B4EA65